VSFGGCSHCQSGTLFFCFYERVQNTDMAEWLQEKARE
jgi:hypothetical protein